MTFKFVLLSAGCLVTMIVPIIFAIVLRKKTLASIPVLFIGAAAFLIANFGLNALINLVLDHTVADTIKSSDLLIVLVDGFQQGFVEELMRFLAMFFFMKNCLEKQNSLMYAAGHGGVEMIISGASYAAMSVGAALTDPAAKIDLDEMPIFTPFLVIILFSFVLLFQVGLSYMVFKAVKDKKPLLAIGAFLIHAFANISTGLEVPLVGLVGPVVLVGGLLIWTFISYRKPSDELY